MDILVIDDHALNRVVVKHMLEAEGIHIYEAGDAETGLAMLDKRSFDLVLMDLHVPGMNGLDATRAIRARSDASCQVPVILLTGDVSLDLEERSAAAGANMVLLKPISMKTLYGALAKLLSEQPRALAS